MMFFKILRYAKANRLIQTEEFKQKYGIIIEGLKGKIGIYWNLLTLVRI